MVHVSKNIFFIELVWLIFHPILSDALQGKQREKHFLHYKFTTLTKADTFPEFSAEVVADDRRVKHFNNEERAWILTEDDWTEPPKDPPDSRNWFIHQIRTLTNCTNSQCSELHVLQRIIGCELEKLPDGTVNLTVFDEYGFDGEDFISFNSDAMKWIDKNPKAKETKEKWNSQTGRNQFLKYYLKTYMNWISTFNNTKQSSPDVHIFARKAPDDDSKLVLTCLATGFYPRDVQMNIRLNRTVLEDQTSSGIRPNDDETFQMRISVKIDRNHEGSYDCLVIHSSLTEPVTIKWAANCADCETNRPPTHLIIILSLAAALVIVSGLIMIGINYYKRRRLRDEIRRYGESEENSYDCNREMLKRSEPHPPHTDQLSSFDDKNGQMITVMEERCAVMTEKEDPNKHVSNSHLYDPDLESSVFI
ncbi:hypothetical protein ABG768_012349 [Culter alburnus]|uniref:Ig-like domain-containing protein n=1 Tax=Culter alburnus TaxID=194366 RepID=A0AAW1Z9X4_CULAL